MKVKVLGTAAGGGLPQWNCACEQCARARRDGTPRTQDCLAVSANGADWYLVNASPDIRVQITAAPELTPGPGRRDTPIRGVLLTDAELDHTLGLMVLREGSALDVYAAPPVLAALDEGFPARRILDPYGTVKWHEVTGGRPVELAGGLRVTAVPLSTKRPRYAAERPESPDWVVAYRFEDPATGGVLVYAPCLADWSDSFGQALDGASHVIVDGSFFYDDEMARTAGWSKTARDMGHAPIRETLERARDARAASAFQCLYTHLNNTNPVLDPESAEYAAVLAAGAQVAAEGQLIEL